MNTKANDPALKGGHVGMLLPPGTEPQIIDARGGDRFVRPETLTPGGHAAAPRGIRSPVRDRQFGHTAPSDSRSILQGEER
jgi:hypothetical protein